MITDDTVEWRIQNKYEVFAWLEYKQSAQAKRIDLSLLWATQRQQVLVVNLLAPPTIRNGGWLY